MATLSGHFSEVTQVKWNSFMKKWVTASEDGTIRTWVSSGLAATLSLIMSRKLSEHAYLIGCVLEGFKLWNFSSLPVLSLSLSLALFP